jgi:uncharacterized CHY-type Zn-finger protein
MSHEKRIGAKPIGLARLNSLGEILCFKCHNYLPREAFSKANTKIGVKGSCKICSRPLLNAKRRRWRLNNPVVQKIRYGRNKESDGTMRKRLKDMFKIRGIDDITPTKEMIALYRAQVLMKRTLGDLRTSMVGKGLMWCNICKFWLSKDKFPPSRTIKNNVCCTPCKTSYNKTNRLWRKKHESDHKYVYGKQQADERHHDGGIPVGSSVGGAERI